MPSHRNKLSEFWQELKRRNVVRVVTVYAGAAFVIIELINNITEPLRLPVWTPTLVIVLLAIGFPIVIIISWIYDVHPEKGMVKTEPADRAADGEAADAPRPSSGWKIASYVSFVLILGLIVLHVFSRPGDREVPDKSIAVLPFRNDSPDEGKMYFINGTMEAILDNLCRIEDLRVPGRTSVEQYRDHPKPIPVVAEEMNVSYVLEGSGHRDGNKIRLFVQLLDGRKDQHIWSKSYDADIADIFSMQSDIAQRIATEIQAIITPEEKDLIEKVPTTSLTAYDFFRRGREEHWIYWNDNENRGALERAEDLYHEALTYDPEFAQAYTGLAWVYWDKHYWEEYFMESFMDSVMILCDKALSYDPQLPEAYLIRGNYYMNTGLQEEGIRSMDQAISYNPNFWQAYRSKGWYYLGIAEEMDQAILNLQKASMLHRDRELPEIMRQTAVAYQWIGFMDQANALLAEALILDRDSVRYYIRRAHSDIYVRNYLAGNELLLKAYALDSSNIDVLKNLGENYMILDRPRESLYFYKKYLKRLEETSRVATGTMHRIGYAYRANGYEEEAAKYLDLEFRYCEDMIRLNRLAVKMRYVYYDLAAIYAFRLQKELALENLRNFNQREKMPLWSVSLIKDDPLFDPIREEPGFQQIVRDVEAKYQAEHERVRQWLEENDML